MKNWLVKRNGVELGHWLAEELKFENDTLYLLRGGRKIGCAAGGPGLTWEVEKKLGCVEVRIVKGRTKKRGPTAIRLDSITPEDLERWLRAAVRWEE